MTRRDLGFEEKEISIYIPLAAVALLALFLIGILYQLVGIAI